METKISIITVNRNNAVGLKKTITSVIAQTYINFEFIIIDGASTDNSVEVIGEYADHLSYWISEPDNGTYHAMNKGIKVSNGEYCFFLNSGDFLVDNRVFEKIFIHNINSDIVSGDVLKVRTNNKFRRISSQNSISLHKLCIHSLPHQATLIRRSLFDEIDYYNESYKIASDWEFFLKALVVFEKSYQHLDMDFSYFTMDGISSMEQSSQLALKESTECLRNIFPKMETILLNTDISIIPTLGRLLPN